MKISETTAAIFGFIVGSSLLITFSVLQRIAFNISNFEIQSFTIPFFIGGFLGAALGYLLARFHARTEEVERLVQIKIEETARIERQKEAALAEQHRITQEILNQSTLVDTLLSALPAPVFFKNPDGKYQGCNRAFEELFGVTAEEVRGKTVHELYDEASAELFSTKDSILVANGGEEKYEAVVTTKDGHQKTIQVTKTTYHLSDGTFGGFLGTILDVTEARRNERALKETAQRLDLALKGSEMGFWDWNIQTDEVIYSDTFISMLGFPREEVVNDLSWWQRLVHPQDSPKVWRQIEQHVRGGFSSITTEFRLKNRSGEWVWMRVRGKIVEKDENKRPLRAAGTLINITDQILMREQLENQIKLVESLLESIPNPVFFKDREGRFLGVNKAYEDFTGLDIENLKGKTASEVWDARFAQECDVSDEFVLSEKTATRYESIRPDSQVSQRNCIVSKAPFFKSDGTVNGLIGIIVDVTDLKQAEKALAESEEKYRTVVEYAGQMIAITQNGIPVFVNRKAVELTGYSEDELLSAGLTVFIHPDDLEREIEYVQNSFVEKNIIPTTQYRIISKDGDMKWCEEQTVLINWKSKPATLHFITDITDRKKAEDILLGGERLKAVADLASGVAHNFNNMLQIIMGGAGLAMMDLDSGDTQRVRAQLKQIVESARFGAGAVRRLEDFANISSKTMVGAADAFDISELIRRAIDMTELWWKAAPGKEGHEIIIETDLTDGLITKILEDDLFEILINVIKNATEALPEGGTIRISSRSEDEKAVIVVEDNGIGIPEENLAKIFEPFWTSKGFKATGMGLSSCLGIIQRYNGGIKIDSVLGKGTTVTISFPLDTETPVKVETPTRDVAASRNLSILVVDDMEMLVDLLRDGLSEFGHRVFTALSGAEAVEIFKENDIDLVISDLGMPNVTGWDVGREIKKICEARGIAKVPFILLTGWGNQQGEQARITESGIDEIVMKPVDLGNLISVIDRITFSKAS